MIFGITGLLSAMLWLAHYRAIAAAARAHCRSVLKAVPPVQPAAQALVLHVTFLS